ncbi:hypothetical protein HWV62_18424 [Athelia sp. TMB]|nr:hypothetical protein HWV62_18424 [Athelia sp. TMB]
MTRLKTSRLRGQQLVTGGHGSFFSSPNRKNYRKKSGTKVIIRDSSGRYKGLHERLLFLRREAEAEEDANAEEIYEDNNDLVYVDDAADMDYDDGQQTAEPVLDPQPPQPPTPDTLDCKRTKRRILPNTADYNEYRHWQENVEDMVDAYLSYTSRSLGKPAERAEVIERQECGCDQFKESSMTCLYFDHFRKVTVPHCACQPLHLVLVLHGLFPSAPQQPKVAVSLELLGLYRAMFERSCDAVNALANALHTFYTRRGFHVLDDKGRRVLDPFRRSLSSAIQWHDTLQIEVQRRIDEALIKCDNILKQSRKANRAELSQDGVALARGEANRQLQKLCPACFGGSRWGRNLDEGGDVHMALDGNFHHRHQAASGDGPHFHDAAQIVPKDTVDAVGNRINAARKRPPRKFRPQVPEEIIQECQDSHTAADGRKAKTDMGHFDDAGLMAMVCRHDVPLFVANIDTPGEQQKYGVALMEHVLALLPPEATCVFIIDVGCVFDVSLNKYYIITDDALKRIKFCTSAMHAYAHQWSCQLRYNPRLQKGMGLSDGEGVERLWSRLRRLIGITRTMGRRHRLWIIDRFLASVAQDHREELGQWAKRKLDGEKGIKKETQRATETIEACAVEEDVLRSEWVHQVETQTSIRTHAPVRLKKEVDVVLSLQTEIGALEKTIEDTRTSLSQAGVSTKDVKSSLCGLMECQSGLQAQVERLYASLNIQDQFPELAGVNIEFIRTLLLARDMKINVRKRAIGSFMEWERLDQAAGGKHQSLGTKIHQKTRNAITKRTPALLRSIRTFNKYCAKLDGLHDPSWNIPIPKPLPTKLSQLRDDSSLMEDVWISREHERIPRWLDDANVRDGIRALMKHDRCLEERRRLGLEADHMCAQLGRELAEVELAIQMPEYHMIHPLLQEHHIQLRLLQPQWTFALQSDIQIKSAIAQATDTANRVLGISPSTTLDWVTTVMLSTSESLDYDSITIDAPLVVEDSEEAMVVDALEDELDGLVESDMLDDDVAAEVLWRLPVRDCALHIQCIAQLMDEIKNDYLLEDVEDLPDDISDTLAHISLAPRVLAASGARSRISYAPEDIARFVSPTSMLNDDCINGAALLLQSHFIDEFSRSDVAILTTHDLVRIRYAASDEDIWRNTKRSEYWTKPAWVLPIHRKDACHWVLCVIYPAKKRVHLIDSFADRGGWFSDIKDIMKLITRLTTIARAKGNDMLQDDSLTWEAYPLMVKPVQRNGYDCGVWTLAGIWAVLKGYEVTSHTQATIHRVRSCLLSAILALPVS